MKMNRPDILVFMSDQHSHLFHKSFGGVVDAPNFDSLARSGALFSQAYTSCPLCVPARMSMLSGRYASDTGIITNDDALSDSMPTFLHSLVEAGYETVLIGRMHFVGRDQRHGFTRRLVGDMTPVTWNRPVEKLREERGVFLNTFGEYHCTDVSGGGESPVLNYDEEVISAALSYFRESHDKPQCVVVGTYGPHFPYVAPADLYLKYRDTVTAPLFFENDPPYFDELMRSRQKRESPETVKSCLAAYCGMIEQTDRYIAVLREAFFSFARERGTEKVFVYLSDHGDQAGERNIYGKQTFFEKSVKIPLAMEGDAIPAGVRIDSPVSIIDLGPTLCSLAGAAAPPRQAGIDLTPLLSAPASGADRAVVSEVMYKVQGSFVLGRMVRQGNYKFILFRGSSDLLFDLSKDPDETKNVINDHGDIADRCRLALARMKPLSEVEAAQAVRAREVELLKRWETAVGNDEGERWKGNPPTARGCPAVK